MTMRSNIATELTPESRRRLLIIHVPALTLIQWGPLKLNFKYCHRCHKVNFFNITGGEVIMRCEWISCHYEMWPKLCWEFFTLFYIRFCTWHWQTICFTFNTKQSEIHWRSAFSRWSYFGHCSMICLKSRLRVSWTNIKKKIIEKVHSIRTIHEEAT